MKTLHRECLGNGRLLELEVLQRDDGTVVIQIDADGCCGELFRGTIEEARLEYRKLKRGPKVGLRGLPRYSVGDRVDVLPAPGTPAGDWDQGRVAEVRRGPRGWEYSILLDSGLRVFEERDLEIADE